MPVVSLNLPASGVAASQAVPRISNVQVAPSALASILDQHLRRPESHDRVFGTLLGYRNSSQTVSVIATSGLKHSIVEPTDGKEDRPLLHLSLDLEGDKVLNQLCKAYGRVEILGWYTTSPEFHSYTPVIHACYAQKIDPLPPILLTVDPKDFKLDAYLGHYVGQNPNSVLSATTFTPLSCSLKADDEERSSLDLINSEPPSSAPINTSSPLANFSSLLHSLSDNLDKVIEYVSQVKTGQKPVDERVGRFLLENISKAPSSSKEAVEDEFNSQLSDVLMLNYLSTLVQAQVEVAGRIGIVPDRERTWPMRQQA